MCEHIGRPRCRGQSYIQGIERSGAKLAAITKTGEAGSSPEGTSSLTNVAGDVGGSLPRKVALARLNCRVFSAIALAAFAVEIPFFFRGTPSGHDIEFHLYSWLEVLSQWKQGIALPRWAALAHFAYGEPRFIFYPPASWTLGAALSAVFPWTLVAGIYIWIVLVAAGASMFLLARQWLDRRDATFAAVLYAVNPYHLVIVYWRSAFAELLASCLLPLLILLLSKAGDHGRRVTISLALVLACAWLINAPAAVMMQYSTILLMFLLAWQQSSFRILRVGVSALLLGAALAAFYLLPATYEQKWINIAQAVSAGSRPQDSFLFIHTSDAEHDAFNRVISWLAVAEIALTAFAAWAARKWRNRQPSAWYAMVIWAAACALLMFSIANPLWSFLPKLRFMQFPWRWMLCLSVPFTLFTALGIRGWIQRGAIYLTMLCVLVFGWQHFQPPWWDTAADLREMQDNVATGEGYEGTDEYAPLNADPSAIDKDARRVTVEGPAHAAIHVLEWSPELKLFTADMSAPDNLRLRLFDYPAWHLEVNGQKVQAGTREGTGQMLVPVQAGTNRVRIIFRRTWDRTVGAWISLLVIVFVFYLAKSNFK